MNIPPMSELIEISSDEGSEEFFSACNQEVKSGGGKSESSESSDSDSEDGNRSPHLGPRGDPSSVILPSHFPRSPMKLRIRKFSNENSNVGQLEVDRGSQPLNPPQEFKSTRLLFGENESCYIMDAKSKGNLGRYMNHSCSPNLFVQNVFVDTQDLRFPWVAYFANQYIRAGSELTWDYNYEVGSVPNKVLYCYCGASECRGRLL